MAFMNYSQVRSDVKAKKLKRVLKDLTFYPNTLPHEVSQETVEELRDILPKAKKLITQSLSKVYTSPNTHRNMKPVRFHIGNAAGDMCLTPNDFKQLSKIADTRVMKTGTDLMHLNKEDFFRNFYHL